MDPYGPYWEVLELEPGSDLDAIKRAYREQAKTWHPDLFPYDEPLRRRCEERMRHVNAAYEALRELAVGGLPPLPEETQAWRPAEEEPAQDVPALDSQEEVPAARTPSPEWASLGSIAAALTLASAALVALFVLPNHNAVMLGQAMRLVAAPALAFAAVAAAARGVLETALGLGLLALALNPVLPVPMSLEDWRIFNAVTPILLLGMFVWTAKRN